MVQVRYSCVARVEDVSRFYGQESSPTTYNLCRMNMIMHDVYYNKFDIKQEDTLENPQHEGEKFEDCSQSSIQLWSANPLHLNDERFSEREASTKDKGDFAFVQHMIHH